MVNTELGKTWREKKVITRNKEGIGVIKNCATRLIRGKKWIGVTPNILRDLFL